MRKELHDDVHRAKLSLQSLRQLLSTHWAPLLVIVLAALTFAFKTMYRRHTMLQRQREVEQERMRAARELPCRSYTLEELQHFNGSDENVPIALALCGEGATCKGEGVPALAQPSCVLVLLAVFNVSEGREFYGREGCYWALTGKDASRMLAKGVHELLVHPHSSENGS